MDTVNASVNKTGHLLALDTGHRSFGVTAEVITRLVETNFSALKKPPIRVSSPDFSCPTAPALAKVYYPRSSDVYLSALQVLGVKADSDAMAGHKLLVETEQKTPSDVPDMQFKGPF
jgi:pyruvate dehydrogenase E1 component beta subunit